MSVRTRTTAGITVHAGTADELAGVAGAYARGERTRPGGYEQILFRRAAADLTNGALVIDLGKVRFYVDGRDGRPFQGPLAPAPEDVEDVP